MRNLFASIACAAVAFAMVLPLAACVSTPTVQELKPRNARAAYAEAEVFLIGALNATDALAARGVISQAQVQSAYATFVQIAAGLDQAYKLLQAGETIAALAQIDAAKLDLDRIALALSMASEAAARAAATPAPATWSPSSI